MLFSARAKGVSLLPFFSSFLQNSRQNETMTDGDADRTTKEGKKGDVRYHGKIHRAFGKTHDLRRLLVNMYLRLSKNVRIIWENFARAAVSHICINLAELRRIWKARKDKRYKCRRIQKQRIKWVQTHFELIKSF